MATVEAREHVQRYLAVKRTGADEDVQRLASTLAALERARATHAASLDASVRRAKATLGVAIGLASTSYLGGGYAAWRRFRAEGPAAAAAVGLAALLLTSAAVPMCMAAGRAATNACADREQLEADVRSLVQAALPGATKYELTLLSALAAGEEKERARALRAHARAAKAAKRPAAAPAEARSVVAQLMMQRPGADPDWAVVWAAAGDRGAANDMARALMRALVSAVADPAPLDRMDLADLLRGKVAPLVAAAYPTLVQLASGTSAEDAVLTAYLAAYPAFSGNRDDIERCFKAAGMPDDPRVQGLRWQLHKGVTVGDAGLRAAAERLAPLLAEAASDDFVKALHASGIRRARGTVDDAPYAEAFERAFLGAAAPLAQKLRKEAEAPVQAALEQLAGVASDARLPEGGLAEYSDAVAAVLEAQDGDGRRFDRAVVGKFLASVPGASGPHGGAAATIVVEGHRLFLLPVEVAQQRIASAAPQLRASASLIMRVLGAQVKERPVVRFSEADDLGRQEQRAPAAYVCLSFLLAATLLAWGLRYGRRLPQLSLERALAAAAPLVAALAAASLAIAAVSRSEQDARSERAARSDQRLALERALAAFLAEVGVDRRRVLALVDALHAYVQPPAMPRFPYFECATSVAWILVSAVVLVVASARFGPSDTLSILREVRGAARGGAKNAMQLADAAAEALAPRLRAAKLTASAVGLLGVAWYAAQVART